MGNGVTASALSLVDSLIHLLAYALTYALSFVLPFWRFSCCLLLLVHNADSLLHHL
jgi:hypothetical protein